MRSSFISSSVFTLTILWLGIFFTGEDAGADSLSDSARIHHYKICMQKNRSHAETCSAFLQL